MILLDKGWDVPRRELLVGRARELAGGSWGTAPAPWGAQQEPRPALAREWQLCTLPLPQPRAANCVWAVPWGWALLGQLPSIRAARPSPW